MSSPDYTGLWKVLYDWQTVIGAILATILALTLPFVISKLAIGRKEQEADLFDRFTKETALRDALLKLKLSASKPNSSQQDSAKEATYKQAEELDARLKEEFERLAPKTPPEELWWRHASTRERFIPPLYEGQKRLTRLTRLSWWIFMILYYVGLLLYGVFGFLSLSSFLRMLSAHEYRLAFLSSLVSGVAFYFLYLANMFRRLAYAQSLTIHRHI